ncbi:FtsK/SpoIIIE domain-containing protein [Amycolatopsis sp. FDAARGOS 1241]|uniref:FtsK/SpoIIIE domain-containing protein n=1 Tax=Amycolatopsis sp. FDAARGOS 1241 TaxID=2778070 RepID=UPI00194F817F|nr:FtsK/SpoIIIE domain-containing protein [Amycolatopsis sp. FDAARGOS 1241]QRP47422.1 ATP-binding protein [Amycolatopsis sp. FDAARGOS 1241]
MNPTDHDNNRTTPESGRESTPESARETGTESTRTPAGPAGELATVHPLRAHTDQHQSTEPGVVESAPVAIEGELVSDEEWLLYTSQKAQMEWRMREYKRQALWVGTHAITAVRHERTLSTLKFVGRNVLVYPTLGAAAAIKRWRDTHGSSRYERMMRAAELAGEHEKVAEWEARDVAEKQRRHDRTMDWIRSPWQIAKAAALLTFSTTVLLLVLGLILWIAGKGGVLDPITGVIDAIAFCVWFVATYGAFLVLAGTAGLVTYLWNLGRRSQSVPDMFRPASAKLVDEVSITPSVVVTALRDLRISELRKKIEQMEDGGAAMLGPIRLAGCGVEFDVHLPSGVDTEEVKRKRRKFAENMGRHEHEVFLSTPPAPRTVRVWAADPGALDQPIGPSPLVTDPSLTADLYGGRAPWGVDLRGDAVLMPLLQAHLLLTGVSKQGKTATLRALALWMALDPSVRFYIADLKGIGDWRMFKPRADVLIEGPSDQHAIAATEMLEWAVEEMEKRLMSFDGDKYRNGVPRELAKPGGPFEPIVCIVDEAQNAFMNPLKDDEKRPYGGQTNESRYFMAARKIQNQGRAVNVVLWQGTQDPTDQNLPKLVREGAHIRGGLVLGSESQSRMAIGDKAVNAGGAVPHELRMGLDKGTLVVAGEGVPLPQGQASMVVRTHFIDGDDAEDIITRAVALRQAVTKTKPQVESPEETRDLLADLAAVLGENKVPAGEVVALLRDLDPDWAAYQRLGRSELVAVLDRDHGIKVPSTSNRWPIDPVTVRDAIARRDLAEDTTGA